MNLKPYFLPTSLVLIAGAIVLNSIGPKPASVQSQKAFATEQEETLNEQIVAKPLPFVAEEKKSQPTVNEGKVDPIPDSPHAIPNEKLLTFQSPEDLKAFLRYAQSKNIGILGRSDRMLSLRLSWSSGTNLMDSPVTPEISNNFYVSPPLEPENGTVQANAVGVKNSLLEQLGITGDNSNWGESVTIAIIDSGITPHSSLPEFKTISLGDKIDSEMKPHNSLYGFKAVLLDANTEQYHGHGTAVASIVASKSTIAPGIAPMTNLLSIPITDESGSSTSFDLAAGIYAAVDAGGQVLNISMGSYGDSPLVRTAIQYALDRSRVVVAASGNSGLNYAAWPAAYEGVISVGAVDASGAHLNFSNASETLSLSAPGYLINTAWSDNTYVQSSGTSFSAPAVSGAISAVLSVHPSLSPTEAAQIVLSHTNEAGQPGYGPQFGNGHLDVGRAINYNTPNITDAAVASHYIAPADSSSSRDQVLVTIQNQGTTELNGVSLTVTTNSEQHHLESGFIPKGGIQTFHLPLHFSPLFNGETVKISSEISNQPSDAELSNNSLTTTIQLRQNPSE